MYYFTTQNIPKANYVERVQKTITVKLYRMMRQKRSYRYIDDLQNIVDNYNATPHRSLNNIPPKEVNKQNEADVFTYMYRRHPRKIQRKVPFQFKKGDLVRISHFKHPFQRSYQEQYTREVFKINSRQYKDGLPMYSLKDLNDEAISGLFTILNYKKLKKIKIVYGLLIKF